MSLSLPSSPDAGSDISDAKSDDFDPQECRSRIMELIGRLQVGEEVDMMSALRRDYQLRSAERSAELRKIEDLGVQRNIEGEIYNITRLNFDKNLEGAELKLISSLNSFKTVLNKAAGKYRRARKGKTAVKPTFSFDNMKKIRRRARTAEGEGEAPPKAGDSPPRRQTKAGELLQIITEQQLEIAALQVTAQIATENLEVHKSASTFVKAVSADGGDAVKVSDDVKEVVCRCLARMQGPRDKPGSTAAAAPASLTPGPKTLEVIAPGGPRDDHGTSVEALEAEIRFLRGRATELRGAALAAARDAPSA